MKTSKTRTSRITRSVPFKSFAMAVGLAVVAHGYAFADYDGTHLNCTGGTIAPGQDLGYTITVQNTGSSAWPNGTYKWVHRVYSGDCSWSPRPPWSYTTGFHYGTVAPGVTDSDEGTFDAEDLPSAPGTYTFWVYVYRPTSTYGDYYVMDGSPQRVTFTISSSPPEMDVRGNSATIADGDGAPRLADHTDFGSTLVAGGKLMRTYWIHNTGAATLNLTGSPRVAVEGTHAAEFSVTSQPAASVAAGGATSFTVAFDPAAVGSRSAALDIVNNDANENPYNFSIQGTGMIPPVFEIPAMGANGSMSIRWTSMANQQYTIHHSTNLNNGFTVLQSEISATPPVNTYTDNVSGVGMKIWKVTLDE